MTLKLAQFETGFLPTNTYVGFNEETGHGFLVDPGDYDAQIDEAMKELGITQLDYILLTHGHFDHILGVPGFRENHPEAAVVISKTDAPFLTDPVLSHCAAHGIPQEPVEADLLVEDGSVIPFDDGQLTVIATPGHTAGSVCFVIEDILFAGDTLFAMSCGRTDFPESVPDQMRPSLQKLAALDGDYNVLPGHDALTTLEYERAHNPFLQ